MSDLRIELRFKNAVLYGALVQFFGERAAAVQTGPMLPLLKVASEGLGVNQPYLAGLLNLKKSPYFTNGERSPRAAKIAEKLGSDFSELFSPNLYSGKFSHDAVFETDPNKFLPLADARRLPAPEALDSTIAMSERGELLDQALRSLSPQEEKIVRMRFGLEPFDRTFTLDEIGSDFGRSKERIRIIESKALLKLRHPSRELRLLAEAS